MAARMLASLMEAPADIDRDHIAGTTEEDILRQAQADGTAGDTEGYVPVTHPRDLRLRLGLTQEAFSAFLRVPLGTIRNWEQGRTPPDPAARTLLALVAGDPDNARSILGGRGPVNVGRGAATPNPAPSSA